MTRRERTLKRYGITPRQYARMLEMQGGRCAICRKRPKTRRLAVDHDHQTKRVRGLLCMRCNRYYVSKNTWESSREVVRYLSNEAFDGRELER